MNGNETITIHLRAASGPNRTPKQARDHQVRDETRFPRIYALLKAAGHDSMKATEILRDARYNDAHARIWIKAIAASRRSVLLTSFPIEHGRLKHFGRRIAFQDAGAPGKVEKTRPLSENEEYNCRLRLFSLAYEALGDLKIPADRATEESTLSFLSRAFLAKATEYELYQAVEAHKFDLEITQGASALDQEILDHRLEAVQGLLDWLSQGPGLEPPVSPAIQKQLSAPPAVQKPLCAPNAPKVLAGSSAILATCRRIWAFKRARKREQPVQ
jgi:hypothetical protein